MKQKLNKLEKYWVMYDVGNSAFALLVSTIIPIYFKNMAAGNGISASDSTAYLSYAISISTLIVAILGPVLGTVAVTAIIRPSFCGASEMRLTIQTIRIVIRVFWR